MPDSTSEDFGTGPNHSASFGNAPKDSEDFRTLRNGSELRQSHTLTVREVARLFEAAGAGRTERSITNWCRPNKTGIARLDSYFDPNERKYFITPQSVEVAIQEELARGANGPARDIQVAKQSGEGNDRGSAARNDSETDELKGLQQEIMDLKITNRGKDYFIEQLQKEREGFDEERQRYIEDLMRFNRRVGELETKLNQIEAPAGSSIDDRQSTAV